MWIGGFASDGGTSKLLRAPAKQGASSAPHRIIDSRRLLYFYHVAKAGRFLGAEATLDIAQSAVSRQIQQLENDLGVQLLERTGHGVKLTPYGDILYREAEEILSRMASTIAELGDAAHNSSGSVSIAAPPTFTNVYMAEIIFRFQAVCPTVRVRAIEGASGAVMNYLIAGEVDCAIVLRSKKAARVIQRDVLTEPLCVICASDHPIARRKNVARNELRDLDLVLPAALNGSRAILRDYFSAEDIPLRSQIEADSLVLTRKLLMQRRLCTILPPSSCEEQIAAGALTAIPLKPTLTRTLSIATLRAAETSKAARMLIDTVADVVKARTSLRKGEL
jgi:DNA-binding transcriptional LysR family regulator